MFLYKLKVQQVEPIPFATSPLEGKGQRMFKSKSSLKPRRDLPGTSWKTTLSK